MGGDASIQPGEEPRTGDFGDSGWPRALHLCGHARNIPMAARAAGLLAARATNSVAVVGDYCVTAVTNCQITSSKSAAETGSAVIR